MTIKIEHEGEQIEVYTADEVKTQTDTAVKAKEDEFGKTKVQLEAERDEARKILGERTTEVRNFRKLNEDQVAKLSIAERTIYENTAILEEERKKREDNDKKVYEGQVDASLKAKAGTDEKLFTKMKEVWGVIGVEAITPEQIERKTMMVLGAIGTTQPDLVASVNGFGGGSYVPPKPGGENENKNFADTDQGKAAAAELGLILETPKK